MDLIFLARWLKDDALSTLPNVEPYHGHLFSKIGKYCTTLPGVKDVVCRRDGYEKLAKPLREDFEEHQIIQIYKVNNIVKINH